jgi:hypothetical protein
MAFVPGVFNVEEYERIQATEMLQIPRSGLDVKVEGLSRKQEMRKAKIRLRIGFMSWFVRRNVVPVC